MNWIEKCRSAPRITPQYAKNLVDRHRGANAQVAQSLIGMIMRGETFEGMDPLPALEPLAYVEDDISDDDAEGD